MTCFLVVLTANYMPSTPTVAACILSVVSKYPQFVYINPPCNFKRKVRASVASIDQLEYQVTPPVARFCLQTLLFSMPASCTLSQSSSSLILSPFIFHGITSTTQSTLCIRILSSSEKKIGTEPLPQLVMCSSGSSWASITNIPKLLVQTLGPSALLYTASVIASLGVWDGLTSKPRCY